MLTAIDEVSPYTVYKVDGGGSIVVRFTMSDVKFSVPIRFMKK